MGYPVVVSVKVSSKQMVSYWSVVVKGVRTGSSMLKPGPGGFSGWPEPVMWSGRMSR